MTNFYLIGNFIEKLRMSLNNYVKAVSIAPAVLLSISLNAQVVLLKDCNPGNGDSNPMNFSSYNNKVYFEANYSTSVPFKSEIWATDGTTGGTSLLSSISNSGSSTNPVNSIVQCANTMLFIGNAKLYKSDGTTGGTTPALNSLGNPISANIPIVPLNSKAYVNAWMPSTGYELYSYDPAGAGAFSLVKEFAPGSSNGQVSVVGALNNKLLLVANDGNTGSEVWISDGTTSGTVLLKDIAAGSNDAFPTNFFFAGNLCYFNAYDGSQFALWVTDGTTAGTNMFYNNNATLLQAVSNRAILLTTSNNLISVAIPSGTTTTLLSGVNPITSTTKGFCTTTNGNLYFVMTNTVSSNYDIWKSDGTPSGTSVIKNLPAYPYLFTPVDSIVFFTYQSYGRLMRINSHTQKTDTVDASLTAIGEMFPYGGGLYISGYDGGTHGLVGAEPFYYHTGILVNVTQLDEKRMEMSLHPVPATAESIIHLNVGTNLFIGSRVLVFNSEGKMVHSFIMESEKTVINTVGFKSGQYFVKLIAKNGNCVTGKFILTQ